MPQTFIGIDPGLRGAIGVLNSDGCMEAVWDLPTRQSGARTRRTQVDVDALWSIFNHWLVQYPDPVVRLEWPTTRPNEAAEASKNFGVGLGQLEAMATAAGLSLDKVAPNKWKADLGLPGKKKDKLAGRKACEFCEKWVETTSKTLLYGPRGGPRDGRAEALLIAWHGWSRTLSGMRKVVERFGRGSIEAQAFTLMAGSGKRGRKPLNLHF